MRICLYSTTTLPKLGGQELVVNALSEELSLLGHDVTVLAPRPRRPLEPDDNARPYRVARHPRFVSSRFFVSFYGRYLRSLSASLGGFDVINAHDVYPTGWLATRNHAALQSAVVITSHGGDLNEGNVRIIKRGVLKRCAQALAGADALVSIGRFTEANFRRVIGDGPRRPMRTIPNGVHIDQIARGRSEKPAGVGEGPFLLFLGRLHCRKGVDVLLHALARAPGVRLLIAGAGDEAEPLSGLARQLQLIDTGRARFLGRVVGPQKLWLLQNALAVVMPSRGWEGCPLVALEAAAARRPVIASRVAGLEDLVVQGQTGELVSEGDADALAGAMLRLWNNPAQAQAFGQAAAHNVRRYAWPTIAREYLEIYDEAIRRRAASGNGPNGRTTQTQTPA